MKKLILLFSLGVFGLQGMAQTMEQTMEKRAREMHRVIGLSDKEQWKKFVTENYSKTLIEKSMKAKVSRQDDESSSSENKEIKGTVEDKVNMFQRLHDDFGDSKIVSIKPNGENLEMVLGGLEVTGTFKLKFDKNSPYLIEGLGIQVEGGGR